MCWVGKWVSHAAEKRGDYWTFEVFLKENLILQSLGKDIIDGKSTRYSCEN